MWKPKLNNKPETTKSGLMVMLRVDIRRKLNSNWYIDNNKLAEYAKKSCILDIKRMDRELFSSIISDEDLIKAIEDIRNEIKERIFSIEKSKRVMLDSSLCSSKRMTERERYNMHKRYNKMEEQPKIRWI